MKRKESRVLTGSAARTGVDGFIPLVGTGHGKGALMHSIFTAAKHRPARLQGRAAVGVRSTWKTSDKSRKMKTPLYYVPCSS